jgi:sugar lactone lactonase YvrE
MKRYLVSVHEFVDDANIWVGASPLPRRGTITVMKLTSLVSLIVGMIGLPCWAQQITVSPQLIAGSSAPWPTGDGGPAVNASLGPGALAWDLSGNLLVFDAWSKTIRKITPDGIVSKLFDYPISPLVSFGPMRLDSKGNLYFVHCEYGPCSLSKFDPSGKLTNVSSAPTDIQGLAIDASNNVYVAQESPGYVWRIAPDGTLLKIAGSGTGLLDGNSAPALSANLGGVHSLAFDSSGNLLMAGWDFLSRLDPDGNVVQLAGTAKLDGFNGYIYFQKIAASQSGVFATDGNQILRLDSSGSLAVYAGILSPGGYGVTTFSDGCALSGGSRVGIDASLYPGDIILDNQGRLYDADGRVRSIDPDGSIRTIAGTGGQPHESPSGTPALQAILYDPGVVVADGFGNAFFTEPGANRVQEITAGGLFVTVTGTNSPPPGDDVACYRPTGDVLSNPKGVAVDANGNVYISDTGNHRIRRVSPGNELSVA